jgi:hypothetical protein
MLRATHTELASATDDTAELAAAVRTLQGALAEEQRRSSDLSAELERFKAEAQQGVIAATRAANEARQAVGAALTTLSAVQQQQPAAASSAAAAQLGGIEARVLADLADVRAQASPVEVEGEGRGDGMSGEGGFWVFMHIVFCRCVAHWRFRRWQRKECAWKRRRTSPL